jgi:hypothetical protein
VIFSRLARHTYMTVVLIGARRSERDLWSRALSGNRDAFAAATGRLRRKLKVHCYRMLASAEMQRTSSMPPRAALTTRAKTRMKAP